MLRTDRRTACPRLKKRGGREKERKIKDRGKEKKECKKVRKTERKTERIKSSDAGPQ